MTRILRLAAILLLLPGAFAAAAEDTEQGHESRKKLLDTALRTASLELNPQAGGSARAAVAVEYADAGMYDEALAATELIAMHTVKVRALVGVSKQCAENGDLQEAAEILGKAREVASAMKQEGSRAAACQEIAEGCASMGSTDAALALLQQLLGDAQALRTAGTRDGALEGLTLSAQRAGFPKLARQACLSVSQPGLRARILTRLALSGAEGTQSADAEALLGEAQTLAAASFQPAERALSFATIGTAYAELGYGEQAARALAEANSVVPEIGDATSADEVRTEILRGYLACDNPEEALALSEQMGFTSKRREAIDQVVAYHSAAGRLEEAVEVAREVGDEDAAFFPVLRLAESWAWKGEYDQALEIVDSFPNVDMRDKGRGNIVIICGRNGDLARGHKLVGSITNRGIQGKALSDAAIGYLQLGDQETLLARCHEVEQLAPDVVNLDSRLNVATALVESYLAAGARDEAVRVAREAAAVNEFANSLQEAHVRAIVGTMHATAGETETARRLFEDAIEASGRVSAKSRHAALAGIAKETIKADMLDLAVTAMRGLMGDADVGMRLVGIAEQHLKAGRKDDARGVIADLCERVKRTQGAYSRVEVLAALGSLYERYGLDLGPAEQGALKGLLSALDVSEEPTPRQDVPRAQQIKLVHFHMHGCSSCMEVKHLVEEFARKRPDVEVHTREIRGKEAAKLNSYLCARAGLPRSQYGRAPSVFSANKGIVKDNITAQSLESLAESARGLPAPWDLPGGKLGTNLTAGVVVVAGLVDSINPCAFAVIIFLITYLSYMKKSKSEIALVGFLQTLAVFVTYFAIGMGLYGVLGLTDSVSVLLNRILYWAMAVMLVVATVLSVVDGIRCLQGRPEEMKLKLPEAIRNRIKLLITRRARLGLTVVATLVLGAVVALLEFPCTGGIYGPTIAALVQLKPESWVMFGWLLIYNFCFILPLIVIFVVIYAGVSSETLVRVFQRHMATIKFAMAVVFVGLFVVLLVLMP